MELLTAVGPTGVVALAAFALAAMGGLVRLASLEAQRDPLRLARKQAAEDRPGDPVHSAEITRPGARPLVTVRHASGLSQVYRINARDFAAFRQD